MGMGAPYGEGFYRGDREQRDRDRDRGGERERVMEREREREAREAREREREREAKRVKTERTKTERLGVYLTTNCCIRFVLLFSLLQTTRQGQHTSHTVKLVQAPLLAAQRLFLRLDHPFLSLK